MRLTDLFRRPKASAAGGFEAASRTPRMRGIQASREAINPLLTSAGSDMIARGRYLVRNNAYASNAVDAWTAHAVGTGIKPNPQGVPKEVKEDVLDLFRLWTDEADADGITDFYGLQRRVGREVFIAGECFVRFRPRKPEDGLTVPLQLQILPSEMVPIDLNRDLGGGRAIRNGIEFDALGRRVAYHVYPSHPGDTAHGLVGGDMQPRPIPASEILHVYDPQEAGQVRGVSKFAPAIVKLFMLDQYDDAELERKKTAALFVGFVKKTGETDPFGAEDEGEGEGIAPLEPGLMQYLDDNEDVVFSSPTDVGQQYEAFQYRTLLQIAAALGIPYQLLTGDPEKANFSNARSVLIDFRRRVEAFQYGVLVFLFCRAVWRRWLETAWLAKAAPLPKTLPERRSWLYAEWLPPRWDWVDPQKDTRAEIEQINAGLKSRTQALHERGYDPEQVDREIAADREREKRHGLTFAAPGAPKNDGGDGGDAEEDPPKTKE